MKYVFTGGEYTQFMGRTFAFGKPVDITDGATLKAIEKRRDFARLDKIFMCYTETKEEPAPVLQVVNMDACPKCGKSLGRGKYLHVKFCKGAP